VDDTIGHLRSTLGEKAWAKGMYPDKAQTSLVDNPYQYSDYRH
jgi:hypothetical protein